MMQEDSSVGWDPATITPHVSPFVRIYVLFLLVSIIAAMVKLIALWIAAPPFFLSRKMHNPNYLQRLRMERVSLQQWMICALLGGAFVGSAELYRIFTRLVEAKPQTALLLLDAMREFSIIPEMVSFLVLFLFVIQWHLLNRIQRMDRGSKIVS